MGGKSKFTDKDIEGMKKTAALNAADRNPYCDCGYKKHKLLCKAIWQ